ncbi:MAG TPA: peptidoglycan DD-metalloendopeptidase family protein [Propionibacteriaceae bacterium]|nr:peptidoglycan DD-metalloendopeptidase family protein [Propionibacteriaceae bacterium]
MKQTYWYVRLSAAPPEHFAMSRMLAAIVGLVAMLSAAVLPLMSLASATAAEPALPGPSRWPLDGPIRQVRGFDPPDAPWGAGHRGIDLAAEPGQAVFAAADGVVTFAGPLAGRGVVVVTHGRVRTTYEPVIRAVAVGVGVRMGQRIGSVAVGAHCARACLHWGLRQAQTYLDPSLLGGARSPVRLVAESARDVAKKRTAGRAAARDEALRSASFSAGSAAVGLRPDGLPFGQPVSGGVTSGFGMRRHPVLGVWKLHDGTDFGASCGTPILAPAPGRVRQAYFNAGYGNRLLIDHGIVQGQRVVTAFNHAERYVVRPGQAISRGELIGFVGATGYSTGCHLHLMLWLNGTLTNPMTWFSP